MRNKRLAVILNFALHASRATTWCGRSLGPGAAQSGPERPGRGPALDVRVANLTRFRRFADPRVKDWLLMSSPFPTLFICLTYVYCVKSLGPRLMANRKPFDLRNVLLGYNAFQVAFSAWLFYEVRHKLSMIFFVEKGETAPAAG